MLVEEEGTSKAYNPIATDDKNKEDQVLRRGDLARIIGHQSGKIKSHTGCLVRVVRLNLIDDKSTIDENQSEACESDKRQNVNCFLYDVELILGGKLSGVPRFELRYTTASEEGMTGDSRQRRKRKQVISQDDTISKTEALSSKKKLKKINKNKTLNKTKKASTKTNTKNKNIAKRNLKNIADNVNAKKKRKNQDESRSKNLCAASTIISNSIISSSNNGLAMFERHRREFERCISRLQKIDVYNFFSDDDVPPEFDDCYKSITINNGKGKEQPLLPGNWNGNKKSDSNIFPNHPPYNFVVLRKRLERGQYILDRERLEREEYFDSDYRNNFDGTIVLEKLQNFFVLNTTGVDWISFRKDVIGMCAAAVERNADDGGPGTLSNIAEKIKVGVNQMYDKTGRKQTQEMELSNDADRFTKALNVTNNTEAAMQGKKWKKDAFPEREYERLTNDTVCAGLSELDERIATYELRTNLNDSFIGLSYTYNDAGQSEVWMKTILENSEEKSEEEKAAVALSSDDGVIKAQVAASMQSLLIAVQDRVMTDNGVLEQTEIRSANWVGEQITCSGESVPEIAEQPVWGIDCYTRKNISICLETKFDPDTISVFIEKWLLPAINACPVDMAHELSNACRILEGFQFDASFSQNQKTGDKFDNWRTTLFGQALTIKIKEKGPVWLFSAAWLLRKAINAIGLDFFRVHPKGHGSIVLCSKIEPNRLVTFYHGEVYPSWRWGEKMDAISLIQQRKNLKPRLPDFYNMALERPQTDPRGYSILFVDASRKSGYGSMLSHSCNPSCEVRVAAVNGKLTLAMTTLRELTIGDELTFDYNAVTESLHEFREAVCLCGQKRCRGSFLHFATADCYQQVLNRNLPFAVRLSQLVKGCTKKVMSEEDELILKRHGFQTAAFGAVSVKRKQMNDLEFDDDTTLDSMDFVPIWLRSHVADILRYIEYERRALPIALISNQISQSKDSTGAKANVKTGPLQQYNETISADNNDKGIDNKPGKGSRPQSLDKTNQSKLSEEEQENKISFEAADSEGIAAIEQRIQQLTQSLSRVGRVLDRHREVILRQRHSENLSNQVHSSDTLKKLTHPPLSIMPDEDVVAWMWNHEDGIIRTLLRMADEEICVSPDLNLALKQTESNYSILRSFGDNWEKKDTEVKLPVTPAKGRQLLDEALLEFRKNLINGIDFMASEIKTRKVASRETVKQKKEGARKITKVSTSSSLSEIQFAIKFVLNDIIDTVDQSTNHGRTENVDAGEILEPWLRNYNKRFKLEKAADLLLMHMRTSTFFRLMPYESLQSTPIEVYAREVGNCVQRSVIDKRKKDGPLFESCSETCAQDLSDGEIKRKLTKTAKMTGRLCKPDDIISEVVIDYQGDYVLSQLLQWYNAGIGQKPGLPDMLGCAILPSMAGCWKIDATKVSNSATNKKTSYNSSIRPALVEWLKDPYKRGNPWPDDIRRGFVDRDDQYLENNSILAEPIIGSPILDFLVAGNDFNITNLMQELGRNCTSNEIDTSDALLSSHIDVGRPAQAVSNWIQCENPDCQKWRKIPWHVDIDMLSEKFICSDNFWEPLSASCDALEDDWDETVDACVGVDGSIDVNQSVKNSQELMNTNLTIGLHSSSCNLTEYKIGNRYDVLRPVKEKWCIASVVDLTTDSNKVKLHFARTQSKNDIWLEKQSDRIVALHTHTSALESKSKKSVKSKLSSSLCSKKFRKEKSSSKSKQKKPNNQESEAKELTKQSADDVVLSQENDEKKCCDNKLDIKHAPKFSVVKDAGEKDFIGCNKAVNDKKVIIDRVHMAEKKQPKEPYSNADDSPNNKCDLEDYFASNKGAYQRGLSLSIPPKRKPDIRKESQLIIPKKIQSPASAGTSLISNAARRVFEKKQTKRSNLNGNSTTQPNIRAYNSPSNKKKYFCSTAKYSPPLNTNSISSPCHTKSRTRDGNHSYPLLKTVRDQYSTTERYRHLSNDFTPNNLSHHDKFYDEGTSNLRSFINQDASDKEMKTKKESVNNSYYQNGSLRYNNPRDDEKKRRVFDGHDEYSRRLNGNHRQQYPEKKKRRSFDGSDEYSRRLNGYNHRHQYPEYRR